MIALTLVLSLLTQTDDVSAPAAADPGAAVTEPTQSPAVKSGGGATTQTIPPEVQKLLNKINSKDLSDRVDAIMELQQKYNTLPFNPMVPPADIDLENYLALGENEQAKLMARKFIEELITADVGRLVSFSGLPFMMEDRRIDRPEDLRAEWAKQLRGKRTDLLKTFDVSIFSATDMEKKSGRPPPRLNSWQWRAPKTLMAVANLSGHGTVLLLRQVGATWQVVGFHD